jgi:hypothetical protein
MTAGERDAPTRKPEGASTGLPRPRNEEPDEEPDAKTDADQAIRNQEQALESGEENVT